MYRIYRTNRKARRLPPPREKEIKRTSRSFCPRLRRRERRRKRRKKKRTCWRRLRRRRGSFVASQRDAAITITTIIIITTAPAPADRPSPTTNTSTTCISSSPPTWSSFPLKTLRTQSPGAGAHSRVRATRIKPRSTITGLQFKRTITITIDITTTAAAGPQTFSRIIPTTGSRTMSWSTTSTTGNRDSRYRCAHTNNHTTTLTHTTTTITTRDGSGTGRGRGAWRQRSGLKTCTFITEMDIALMLLCLNAGYRVLRTTWFLFLYLFYCVIVYSGPNLTFLDYEPFIRIIPCFLGFMCLLLSGL